MRSYPNITLENNVVTDEFVATIMREEDVEGHDTENVPEKSVGGRLSDVLKFIGEDANVTISELARQAIVGCKISTRISSEQADWLRQLSGIANNLNQATRKLHQQGYNDDYRPIVEQIDVVSKLILDDGKDK